MAQLFRITSLLGYLYLVALGVGVVSFLIALFSQHVLGMAPCAWCVFQRLILLGVCFFALLACFFHQKAQPKSTLVMGFLLVLSSLTGIASAWHQYTVAAAQFSCSLTFADKAITQLGLDKALPKVFGIYASCMDAKVSLLGLDYALWALGLFIFLSMIGLAALGLQYYQRPPNQLPRSR